MISEIHKEEILSTLRATSKAPLRDEHAALKGIEVLAAPHGPVTLEQLVYSLGLIYSSQTNAMPGYTNSDNETLFERFALAVLKRVAPRTTLNQLRSAIRKMDAKRNSQFKADLDQIAERRPAAE